MWLHSSWLRAALAGAFGRRDARPLTNVDRKSLKAAFLGEPKLRSTNLRPGRSSVWENVHMAASARIMRAAALILLLTAACDILVVDTAFAAACTANTTEDPASAPGDDDCYCCCTHIVLAVAPMIFVTCNIEAVSAEPAPVLPLVDPQSILHPPRS
jgi:hypothetical protein